MMKYRLMEARVVSARAECSCAEGLRLACLPRSGRLSCLEKSTGTTRVFSISMLAA